ncbi:MAG: hypothetical protein AAFU60_05040 [Bacteroidota bacterium]
MKVEFIFSEFGSRELANQPFSGELRLHPTFQSVRRFFEGANLVLYTDQEEIGEKYPGVELRIIDVDKSPFDRKNHRWGWHCCDYYQVQGLLESKADIAISVDSDLVFVSEEVRTILPIIERFGICVPTNPRQLVKVDGIHTRGNDGDYRIDEDESRGNLLTYDLWWMGFDPMDQRGRRWLEEFSSLMQANPKRGPLQLTRACWNTGIFPYSMAKQWGVGKDDLGIGNEIILHAGHEEVIDFYKLDI